MQNRTNGEPGRIRRETENERLGETGRKMKRIREGERDRQTERQTELM